MNIVAAAWPRLDVTEHRQYVDLRLPNGQRALDFIQHFIFPYRDVNQTLPFVLPYRVAALAEELNSKGLVFSNPQRIIELPAFKALQKIGKPAIPQLLRWLGFDPYVWLVALPVLTGEDPVLLQHVTSTADMIADWKQWGIARGYIR